MEIYFGDLSSSYSNFYNILTSLTNKFKKISFLFLFLYFFSESLTPCMNDLKNLRYFNRIRSINNISKNSFTHKAQPNFLIKNSITSVTYISNKKMVARQINTQTLQSYTDNTQGSVLKLNTLNSSAKNEFYSYDSYGNIISTYQEDLKLKSNLIPNSFEYNNERFDSNTNLQYLRARFYMPQVKRFITEDSFNLPNKFNYTNSNPVNFIDPSGHVFKKIYLTEGEISQLNSKLEIFMPGIACLKRIASTDSNLDCKQTSMIGCGTLYNPNLLKKLFYSDLFFNRLVISVSRLCDTGKIEFHAMHDKNEYNEKLNLLNESLVGLPRSEIAGYIHRARYDSEFLVSLMSQSPKFLRIENYYRGEKEKWAIIYLHFDTTQKIFKEESSQFQKIYDAFVISTKRINKRYDINDDYFSYEPVESDAEDPGRKSQLSLIFGSL